MGTYLSDYPYFVTSYYVTGVERTCYKGDDVVLADKAYKKSINNKKVVISTFYVEGKKRTSHEKECIL
jgi:hypothetical protein